MSMNPYDAANSVPNFWLSCLIIDESAMGEGKGKSIPEKILAKIADMNAEGRPIWKPMHMQPMYKEHAFVSANGSQNVVASVAKQSIEDVGADIFTRGLCLPSDNKMTPDQQDAIIETIRECFA